jgi:cell division protein FtsB
VSARAHRAAPVRRRPSEGKRSRPKGSARPGPSYRLAPRRPSRGRSRSRIDWDRFGRIALVLVLFVVLVLYVNPISNFIDAWQESKAEKQRLAEARSENERLHRKATVLDDPDAAEHEARRIGMVAPGERAYVIHGLGR